jgi:flavodoxin
MKVGIIVYSKTGNTLAVAERIQEKLKTDGIAASVERFCAETLPQSNKPVRLTAIPNPNAFDAVIFGAPVQAFSLDPAMSLYLETIEEINPKNILCFVTQHFKKPWMGGNHAMKQMLALLQKKGASARSLGVVNWSHEQREAQIERMTQHCANALKEIRI